MNDLYMSKNNHSKLNGRRSESRSSDSKQQVRQRLIRPGQFLVCLALLTITVLAYLPVINDGGFIWDDESYVTHNKTLRDLEGLKQMWVQPQAIPQYYPLVHTTFWVEYQLWQLDPTGYHVTNVLLHALGAVLLWLLLRRLKIPGAWLAAALFAVHPVHVESVAWVTERKNVLSGVFYLGAALSYLKWSDARAGGDRKWGSYCLALVLFLGALLSKTVTATLPAALLLVMWWRGYFDSRRIWKQIRPLAPFFAMGLALSYLTVWLEIHHVGAKGAEWHLTFIDRCLIAGRALWFYAGKLLWPSQLCFSYQRWEIDATAWWQYLYPLSFVAVTVVFWVARRRFGRGPLVAVLFFAGTLLPALGFFDVYPMRYSFVADHFQYLASIGLLALLSAAIVRTCQLVTKARLDDVLRRPAGAVTATAVLIVFATLTWNQCGIYRNLETLWLDTIRKNPSSWMAYINLGQVYVGEGRASDAVPLFEKAIQLNPEEVEARYNLGVALARTGHEEDAMAHYRTALDMAPNDPQVYSNLGAALARLGRFDEAVSHYKKALEINQDLAPTHSNLGAALARLGRVEEAIQCHEKAIEIDPEMGALHFKYGETLHIAGRVREAEDQYRTAALLDPSLTAAHINLGKIAMADKLNMAALDHFRRAVRSGPDVAEARNHLAVLLAGRGNNEEAVAMLKRAVELDPENAEFHNNLGVLLVRMGRYPEGQRALEEALRLKPDYGEARKNLEDLRNVTKKRSQP